jgi:hypothetical protein
MATIRRKVETGIVRLTLRSTAEVFNPTTCPDAFTSGPPENPGYITTSDSM